MQNARNYTSIQIIENIINKEIIIMNNEQELFYKELRKNQDFVIGNTLCKQSKYKEM